jgi:hypothetical protein
MEGGSDDERIHAINLGALVLITGPTCEPEIVNLVIAARGHWDDMVYL